MSDEMLGLLLGGVLGFKWGFMAGALLTLVLALRAIRLLKAGGGA